jgi:hypothetical protein
MHWQSAAPPMAFVCSALRQFFLACCHEQLLCHVMRLRTSQASDTTTAVELCIPPVAVLPRRHMSWQNGWNAQMRSLISHYEEYHFYFER